ncbi:unnamed protein product [Cladocopium goreaui]|uniref:Uncharacterized protein n=1 Tax=Cladocopium goreaui TaxID=2562237 RepID=A0A9P1M275_9DINO|nr:unnamed protein product [Cladocopium goreaui]
MCVIVCLYFFVKGPCCDLSPALSDSSFSLPWEECSLSEMEPLLDISKGRQASPATVASWLSDEQAQVAIFRGVVFFAVCSAVLFLGALSCQHITHSEPTCDMSTGVLGLHAHPLARASACVYESCHEAAMLQPWCNVGTACHTWRGQTMDSMAWA